MIGEGLLHLTVVFEARHCVEKSADNVPLSRPGDPWYASRINARANVPPDEDAIYMLLGFAILLAA